MDPCTTWPQEAIRLDQSSGGSSVLSGGPGRTCTVAWQIARVLIAIPTDTLDLH